MVLMVCPLRHCIWTLKECRYMWQQNAFRKSVAAVQREISIFAGKSI
jgi:hypothetical protein